MSGAPTLAALRRYAVARTLFAPTTLARALARLRFVQADPIRAPARAQDLILRHRVAGYRAGDLERRYAQLAVEEDFFVNYGFVTRELHALMHPRTPRTRWTPTEKRRAAEILAFVRERGHAQPRDVDAAFDHGRVENYWGGASNATTQLLDRMHYRGLVRIARREKGVRVYAAREIGIGSKPDTAAQLDALLDVAIALYAPLPSSTLSWFAHRMRVAAPQFARGRAAALKRARLRLAHATVAGTTWYWPAGEDLAAFAPDDECRLLAPFDPIVWDRERFERLWGWDYRFEAYTPAAKRRFGYYALPMLLGDRVVGWANVSAEGGRLACDVGYARRHARAPRRALDIELEALRAFLRL
ncbi:MAG: YcaQ family DNA glycosylase [Proteobacteria bacterium]|nr:YcaQ family DNA glycosylase [Pseudomonadota bacterium]